MGNVVSYPTWYLGPILPQGINILIEINLHRIWFGLDNIIFVFMFNRISLENIYFVDNSVTLYKQPHYGNWIHYEDKYISLFTFFFLYQDFNNVYWIILYHRIFLFILFICFWYKCYLTKVFYLFIHTYIYFIFSFFLTSFIYLLLLITFFSRCL